MNSVEKSIPTPEERTSSDNELRTSEARFKAAIAAVAGIVWTNDSEGRMKGEQHGWSQLSGQTRDQYTDFGWTDVVHPDDAAPTVEAWNSAVAEKRLFNFEHRLRTARGEWRLFSIRAMPVLNSEGGIVEWVGVHTDITDERLQKEELRLLAAKLSEAEERYRLSLSAGRMGTWSVDLDTKVTVMNERFASLFGVEPDVADRGASLEYFMQLIHSDDRPDVTAAVTRAMQEGAAYDIDYRIVPQDGKTVWVSVKGQVFTDEQSGKRRFAGVATDITGRKEAELALQDADRRKDEFLAMLAHELRNPLAPISAAAALLRMRTLDPDRVAMTSDVIGRQVAHMTHLIDDLLDVSRVTRGLVALDMKEEELGSIIADAVEQVTPLIRSKNQRISIQLATQTTLVCGDKKRLVQVLSNILNNAAKYTPGGGHILLTSTVTSTHVQINVADNGIGMDPALVNRAFELFSQAERSSDRASGGLGVGLALVKSLVELHKGTVSAFSAGVGTGSTFSLVLPRIAECDEKKSSAALENAWREGAAPLRIVVVDDNQDAALLLAMLLEAIGHKVTVEYTSKAALAHSASAAPDVFLLDIGLPEIDGNALARTLRAQPETAGAVLIAVTGYGQEQDREATRVAGFDHHLVKPLDTDHLVAILNGIAQTKS